MVDKTSSTFGSNSQLNFSFFRNNIFFLIVIGTVSFLIRMYYFPFEVPLNFDALSYFWYSSDIYQIGGLPNEWLPNNTGWPIFVSFFFIIFNSNDVLMLMQIQRLLSVIISVLAIIPIYFLCKRFVEPKFAIVGASFIAFDPRLMINSFLGVTDPLYFLLITTSLALFLYSRKEFVYLSFVFASLSVLVRAEGLTVFLVLSIMFFIRYRNENYKVFLRYLTVLGIFILVVLPLTLYQIDLSGHETIFSTSVHGGRVLVSSFGENVTESNLVNGLEIFIKFLGWITLPNFFIFMPLGIFLLFRKRNFEKITIILSMVIMSIPAFYAYTIPAADTRYLYVLFPMFAVLSVLAIEKMAEKWKKSNILIIIIILGIIISSVIFYDYKKIDYEHEKESFEIMNKISTMVNGTNILYPESSYFNSIQTIKQWPTKYTEMNFELKTVSTDNYFSLEEFIINSKSKNLSHIIIDNKEERKVFLREIFVNESKYPYLKKIFDSKEGGFNYHVKVFEIDYGSFQN